MPKPGERHTAVTSFPFPPNTLGTWRALSCAQRAQWIIAARNRHFKWMKRRGGWPDAAPGTIFQIDGATIPDLPAFFCALGEAVNGPGGYFGSPNMSSLQDCLYGAFGVTLPFILRILNVDACRQALDGKALAEWAREGLVSGAFLDDEGRDWLLQAERSGQEGSRSLLDELLETLQFHKVTIETEEPDASS